MAHGKTMRRSEEQKRLLGNNKQTEICCQYFSRGVCARGKRRKKKSKRKSRK